jgi:hypothetical protein
MLCTWGDLGSRSFVLEYYVYGYHHPRSCQLESWLDRRMWLSHKTLWIIQGRDERLASRHNAPTVLSAVCPIGTETVVDRTWRLAGWMGSWSGTGLPPNQPFVWPPLQGRKTLGLEPEKTRGLTGWPARWNDCEHINIYLRILLASANVRVSQFSTWRVVERQWLAYGQPAV